MIRFRTVLSCVVLAGSAGMSACADRAGTDSAFPELDAATLAARAADQPDSTRDAISRALRLVAIAETGSERAAQLTSARLQARAYAHAWNDSFFIHRVAHFEAASPAVRRAMADVDSLWRAGRLVVGQQGVPAAMRLWRESLRLAAAVDDSAGRAAALYSIGAGFYMDGAFDSATVYLDRAYTLARVIGDHRAMGNAIGILASVSKDSGDLVRAAELYEDALAIRERSGDSRGMAADRNNLGDVARWLGDLEGASVAFEQALALNRSDGRGRPAAINLTNLGDIASIRGEFASAQAYYEEALAINRSEGDVAQTGFVLHHLGSVGARRGDYVRALAVLAEALAIHEQAEAVLEAVSVRADMAAVQAAMGDLESAIATLGRAQDDATEARAPPALRGRLALGRGDLAMQLGSLAQSHAEYERAEQLFALASDDVGRAEAQQGRAMLLLLRDDHAGALRLLELAARSQSSSGDARAAAIAQVLAGEVHRDRGDTAAARQAFTNAHQTFARVGDIVGEAATLSTLGDLALQRGSPLNAESLYQSGLDRLGERRTPDALWRLNAGLASALRRRGASEPAADALRVAIDVIEGVASNLLIEERRTGFMTDKWQVYAALARTEQERGRAGEAFAISERMRARQMLATLDRGRIAARTESSEREQDLRRRISELTREVESSAADAASRDPGLASASVNGVREALAAVQKEYAELLIAMRENQPAYARLVSATFVDWQTVAARLRPDEVLLQYLLTDSASTVFVVTADTVAALDLNVGRATIASLVDFARHTMDRPGTGTAVPLWPGILRRLYHYLIEPAERAGFLDGRRRLVIVPQAELHFLPFGALLAAEPADFLVERFELTYAPSAGVWVRLGERSAPRSNRVLALAPHTARLPASREEVAGIRASHGRGRTTVFLDGDATESALRKAAPHHGILHLATYGVLNKHNPLFSYVELAPEAGGDGHLEVYDAFGLDLDGQLIVLSACQTAIGSGSLADVPSGDDWVGLMQAFLQAGAGGVLASLWTVDDRATAQLMKRFHQALAAGRPDAAALAEAQRAMLRGADTAHPFYWAGFTLSGTSQDD